MRTWLIQIIACVVLVGCAGEDSTSENELDCSGDATSGYSGVSVWPANLADFCPQEGSGYFETNECDGYRIVRRQSVDIQFFDYYRAANGEFVASLTLKLSGNQFTCSGPSTFVVPECKTAWTPVSCEEITPG